METQPQGIEKLFRWAQLPNICEELGDETLLKLGKDVVRFAVLDDASRDEWLKKSEKAMDMALQVTEEKSTPWHGASNVKYPTVTTTALQFHARAYPAIIQGQGVVKSKITGPDPTGEKREIARRVAMHMNWQLLDQQEDWEEGMDKMLLALPIEGCAFKKTYFSADLKHNVSEWVRPKDLIVHVKTKSLRNCPRITHRIFFYPHEIDSRMMMGLWRDADLSISEDEYEEEKLQEFYEQHTFIDLDEDGKKEPYIVTVHKPSEKVVRVVAGYYPEEIQVTHDGRILQIPRAEFFTKYGFIPSPDGGFYDIGFGQLIGPLSDSIDTAINQLIDAGTLSNQQCGFVKNGVSVDNQRGPIKWERGEFKSVKVPANMSLNEAVYQIKFNEPSLVLFNLLGTLIQATKEITSIQDIMTGGAPSNNETATTTMARIEQGLKLFSAIYKRIYRSLKQEFRKIYKLNGKFMNPREYFAVMDDMQEVYLSDYQTDGTDIQPVADPQLATNLLAMAKSQALLQTMGHPLSNDAEILRRHYEALDVPEIDKLIVEPQPQPDPKLQLEVMKAADQHVKTKAEIVKIYADALKKVSEAESEEVGMQLQAYAQGLKAIIDGWQSEMAPRGNNGQGIPGAGGANQASGAGIPGLPQPGQPGPAQNGGPIGLS